MYTNEFLSLQLVAIFIYDHNFTISCVNLMAKLRQICDDFVIKL